MAENIFNYYNRIINQNADCQAQSHQRHIIQRKAHNLHHKEGSDNRRRNTQTADNSRAEIAQEQICYQKRQKAAEKNRIPDIRNIITDIVGLVAHLINDNIRWKIAVLQLLHLGIDIIGNINRIGFGLLAHKGHNAGNAVGAGKGILILPGVKHIGNLTDINRSAVVISNYHLLDIINIVILTQGTHSNFHSVIFRLAAGGIIVVGVQLAAHSLVGNTVFRQLFRLQHNADSTLAGTDNGNLGNTLHHLQLILDVILYNATDFTTAARGRSKGISYNRARVKVNRLRYRLINIIRQSLAHTGNLFTHLTGLHLRVDTYIKFQNRFTVAFKHSGRQRLDTGNLAYAVLNRLGNQRFHFLRRCTAVGNTHADNRQINVRIQINADFRIAADTEHYQQQNKHGGKDRPLDKCSNHRYLPAFFKSILLPSRSLLCPSVTIVSFSSSPLTISASLSLV